MTKLREAVVFAILMENGDGIMGKAPSYIMEKLNAVDGMRHPELLLDDNNLEKYKDWRKRWIRRTV